MNLKSEGITINGKWIAAEELPKVCKQKIDSDIPEWEKKAYRFLLEWVNNDNFIIQWSSGTTGEKKEFRLLKSSMVTSAQITCSLLNLKPGYSALLCLPVDYIAGKMMIVRAWVCGMDLLLTDPDGTPDISRYNNIDFSAMVPLQVFNLLNSEEDLSKIRTLLIGGGEIREDLEIRLKEIPTRIFATYGMAETCSHVALRKVNGDDASSFFTAIPGITLVSDDRDCLIIKADFLPDSIKTNDLVEFSGQNSFRWLGRFDNLINSGGIKIIPEELEEKISRILESECAVLGLPDSKLGQKIVLALEDLSVITSQKVILEKLRKQLDRHAVPKGIYFLEKLPRNRSFKIDRKKLYDIIMNSKYISSNK